MKLGVYAVFMLALTAAPVPPVDVPRLSLDHEPFRTDFRGADGRVRFVTLLSPT